MLWCGTSSKRRLVPKYQTKRPQESEAFLRRRLVSGPRASGGSRFSWVRPNRRWEATRCAGTSSPVASRMRWRGGLRSGSARPSRCSGHGRPCFRAARRDLHDGAGAAFREMHAPMAFKMGDEAVDRRRLQRIAADEERMERERDADALVPHEAGAIAWMERNPPSEMISASPSPSTRASGRAGCPACRTRPRRPCGSRAGSARSRDVAGREAGRSRAHRVSVAGAASREPSWKRSS